jgi:hypothetical protein
MHTERDSAPLLTFGPNKGVFIIYVEPICISKYHNGFKGEPPEKNMRNSVPIGEEHDNRVFFLDELIS